MISDFYGRKSTEDGGRSVTSQEDVWRADCATNGFTEGRLFADPGLSASRFATKARADYDALVLHIQSGQCQMLTLWATARGSRNLAGWAGLLDLCRSKGTLIRVISHDRTYDISNRRDWRTLADEGVDAADESERISENITRGKRTAATRGRPAGRLTYGYAREYDKTGQYERQVIDPAQAAVVREIVQTVRDRGSLYGLARSLNDRGFTAPEGGLWQSAHMGRIASNPAYAALRVHCGEVIGKAEWPPIIDESEHYAVVATLREPGRRISRGTALRWPLSAVALCGKCKSGKLRVHRGGPTRTYNCPECQRTSINGDALDRFVRGRVLERLSKPDALEAFLPAGDDAQLVAAQKEKKALEDQMEGYYDAGLSPAGLVAMEARLLPAIEEAKAKVRRLSMPAPLRELEGVDVVGTWDDLDVALRRRVIEAVCSLRVDAAVPGRPRFDMWRLAGTRWTGDTMTWGERWTEEGL
ncbi:recombinase family protein [Roseateles sp.]|uniref:recombinase family protein n=1 Tax=Roseateles sp. TaxID=1971397 RepID=UPI002F424E46